MTISLADLFTPETRDDVISTFLDLADDLELAIDAWQDGGVVKTMLTIFAQQVADLELLNLEAIKGGFLDTAAGGWLSLLARSVYGVTRLDATFASTDTFRVTNSGTANVDALAGELIVAHAVTNKTYRNRDDLVGGTTLAPGVNNGIVMVADEAGSDSNAAAGTMTVLVSSQSNLTVTNLDACLGSDEELDAALRQRCRDKLGALSPNGAKGAYAYIAKTPAYSATSIPITRVNVVADETTGVVTVYLATALGAPSGGDVTIVDTAIDKWATPWGITSQAVAATPVTVPVTYHVWVKDSLLTPTQIADAIETALDVYLAGVPIGGDIIAPDTTGKIRVGILEIVIAKAVDGVVKVTVAAPAADLSLAEDEVATLGTVTPTVTVLS